VQKRHDEEDDGASRANLLAGRQCREQCRLSRTKRLFAADVDELNILSQASAGGGNSVASNELSIVSVNAAREYRCVNTISIVSVAVAKEISDRLSAQNAARPARQRTPPCMVLKHCERSRHGSSPLWRGP
jgi:hypothetical protein